jgi:hypothetical protein
MGDVIEVLTTATNTVEVEAAGPQGIPGVGVPTGGSALQVLRKASGTDYDTEWSSSGGGSVDLSSPDPIGDVTPNTGAFTTLSATGTATLPHIHGSLAGNLYIHVKNTSGGELTRGTPVYIVGNVGDTDRVEVAAADFDDATKMPAVGLLEQTLANNGSGDAIILGELDEANTNAYTINQELFVGNNGTLTSTRPTTGQVQSVGVVARVNSNTGVIVVNMQGQRSPNETFAAASHSHGNLTNAGAIGTTANLPLRTGTNGVVEAGSFGTAAGSFCEGNDARLSDARTAVAHAASHLPDGADEIFNQSLNTDDSPAFAGLSVASTGGSGVQLLVADDDGTFNNISYASSEQKSEARTSLGLGDAAVEDATAFAASGSITTSGLTQATARILGRTTASTGAVEEIQIGSGLSLSAGELSATGSGVTAVGTTLADILSVSGSDLVADDLTADKLYGWDDSASKAIGYTIGSGLETDTTTLRAKITSDPSGVTGADAITNIMSLTKAEYNAIGSPDAATLFLITDP